MFYLVDGGTYLGSRKVVSVYAPNNPRCYGHKYTFIFNHCFTPTLFTGKMF